MFAHLNAFLKNRSTVQVTAIAVVLVVAVAGMDHATGYEAAFSIFYLLPIALVAWYGGSHQGVLLCIVSAVAWAIADKTAGQLYTRAFIPFWNAGVRFAFFLITATLLTKLKDRLEKERIMARLDGLTGVLTGRAFEEETQTILQLAARYGRPTVIGYIDLDNFKSVNDTRGHAEGDQALRTVAATLLKSVRGTDLIARLGGDEFAVLLPETSDSGAVTAFANLREELFKEVSKRGWPIGFSIGVAVFHVAPSSVNEAIKLADSLMYRVKNGGKNNTLLEEFGRLEDSGQQPNAERLRPPRHTASQAPHS